MNLATTRDALGSGLVAAGLGALWAVYVRSLRLRRHPLRWAVFLALWTGMLAGMLVVDHAVAVSGRQRFVLELQLAILSWNGFWYISRMLRRPWAPPDPYRWSASDKRALWIAAGVVMSGFMLVGGFIAFAAVRGTTSSPTVENDTASTVKVLVAGGCRHDSGVCTDSSAPAMLLSLKPGESQRATRARGHVGSNEVLGFVTGDGVRRCLVSSDGGNHALVSQAPPCASSASGGFTRPELGPAARRANP